MDLPLPPSAARARALFDSTRTFLRPPGWRGKSPREADLRGALLFGRERRVESHDGTEIAYSVHGESGPWVVLIPGYVCPDNFWRYLLPELAAAHRVVVFDLRGLGLSGTPRAPGPRARNLSPDDFSIERHARDVGAILDAESIGTASLIAHSMGGQIALETYRLMPDRVRAIVMLTAPFESPLRTFYGRDFSSVFRVVRHAARLLPRASVLVWRALFLVNPGLTHYIAKLSRALGPDARLEDMASYYRHMALLDPLVMLTMAEAMRSHSARAVLPTVQVPALIIAGDRDTFTPIALAEVMHEEIPDAELVIVEGGSHGTVIEKPEQVNDAILAFLARLRRRRKSGSGSRRN